MYKYLIAGFFIFSFSLTIFSQKGELELACDSIMRDLKRAKTDEQKFEKLNDLSPLYISIEPDSAKYFHKRSLYYSRKLKNDLITAEALLTQLRLTLAFDDPAIGEELLPEVLSRAEQCIRKAKNKNEAFRAWRVKAGYYQQRAILFRKKGDMQSALSDFERNIAIKEKIKDTAGLIGAYGAMVNFYRKTNESKKGIPYGLKAIKLGENSPYKYSLSFNYGNVGLCYNDIGDYPNALKYHRKALARDEKLQFAEGAARHSSNIGGIYRSQGNFAKALEAQFKSLKLAEKDSNLVYQGYALGEIAIIYTMQKQFDKAIEHYRRVLWLTTKTGDRSIQGNQYMNLGNAYMEQGSSLEAEGNQPKADEKYKLAESSFMAAMKIYKDLNDNGSVNTVNVNLGLLYERQGNLDLAITSLLDAMEGFKQSDDVFAEALTAGNLAIFLTKKKKYDLAEKYAKHSLELATKINAENEVMVAHEALQQLYETTGKSSLALYHYKEFIKSKEKLQSAENTRASVALEMQFNFEKKQAADSLKSVAEKEIVTAQFQKEKTQRYSLYGGLAVVILFSVFMFNRFRITNKQKKIIESQKEIVEQQKLIVEEKHLEITDSINYAERIQRSFLAPKELLDENLKDYFIFFQPKAVVSGDFYWAGKLSESNFTLVTADSTGHGVPGAIMSLLNVASLEKAVEHHSNPAHILNYTRKNIIDRLKLDGSPDGGKDGMDCSVIAFDFAGNKFVYAAAYNPVWIVRGDFILEYQAEKMPVGKSDRDQIEFSEREVEIRKGDVVYTFTDGFADQFGGPKGKKFMSKQLKSLLISVASLSMAEQRAVISDTLNNWKGTLEQIDDICLIGIRI